jgi:hypothetical protein
LKENNSRRPVIICENTYSCVIKCNSDTEGFYTLVQEKILERYGKKFDWSLKAQMMGRKAIESAQIFVENSGLTGLLSPEAFLVERESMLQELFPSCTLLPGTVLCLRNVKLVPVASERFYALQARCQR